jgi:four helix bundle protein
MSRQYNFEKLEVWQNCRVLIKEIYLLTSTYPDSESFGLKSQMRRCAISISSNIAEGSGKTHKKNQANFYQIAYASALELLSQLIVSSDLN